MKTRLHNYGVLFLIIALLLHTSLSPNLYLPYCLSPNTQTGAASQEFFGQMYLQLGIQTIDDAYHHPFKVTPRKKIEGTLFLLKSLKENMDHFKYLNDQFKKNEKRFTPSFWKESTPYLAELKQQIQTLIHQLYSAENIINEKVSFTKDELFKFVRLLNSEGLIDKNFPNIEDIIKKTINHPERHNLDYVPLTIGELSIERNNDESFNLKIDRTPLTYQEYTNRINAKYTEFMIRASRNSSRKRIVVILGHDNGDPDAVISSQSSAFKHTLEEGLNGNFEKEYIALSLTPDKEVLKALNLSGFNKDDLIGWAPKKDTDENVLLLDKNNFSILVQHMMNKKERKRKKEIIFDKNTYQKLVGLLEKADLKKQQTYRDQNFITNHHDFKECANLVRKLFIYWDKGDNLSYIKKLMRSGLWYKTRIFLENSSDLELLTPLKTFYYAETDTHLRERIRPIYNRIRTSMLNGKENLAFEGQTHIFELIDEDNTSCFVSNKGAFIQLTRGEGTIIGQREKIYSKMTGYSPQEIFNTFVKKFKKNKLVEIKTHTIAPLNGKPLPFSIPPYEASNLFNPLKNFELFKRILQSRKKRQLLQIPGIGIKLASNIIKANPQSLSDIYDMKTGKHIPGIGINRFRSILDWIQKQAILEFINTQMDENETTLSLRISDTLDVEVDYLKELVNAKEIQSDLENDHHMVKYIPMLKKSLTKVQQTMLSSKNLTSAARKTLKTAAKTLHNMIKAEENKKDKTSSAIDDKTLLDVYKNLKQVYDNLRHVTPTQAFPKNLSILVKQLSWYADGRFQKIGATSTIQTSQFLRDYPLSLLISPSLSKLNLSAILSDVENFRLPTTTKQDRDMVTILESIIQLEDPQFDPLTHYNQQMSVYDQSESEDSLETLINATKTTYYPDQIAGIGDVKKADPKASQRYIESLLPYLKDKMKLADDLFGHPKLQHAHFLISPVKNMQTSETKLLAIGRPGYTEELKAIIYEDLPRSQEIVSAFIHCLVLDQGKNMSIDQQIDTLWPYFNIPIIKSKRVLRKKLKRLIDESKGMPQASIAEQIVSFFIKNRATINSTQVLKILSPNIIVDEKDHLSLILNTPGVFSRKEEIAPIVIRALNKLFANKNITPDLPQRPTYFDLVTKAA